MLLIYQAHYTQKVKVLRIVQKNSNNFCVRGHHVSQLVPPQCNPPCQPPCLPPCRPPCRSPCPPPRRPYTPLVCIGVGIYNNVSEWINDRGSFPCPPAKTPHTESTIVDIIIVVFTGFVAKTNSSIFISGVLPIQVNNNA